MASGSGSILHAINCIGLIVLDQLGTVVDVNPSAEAMLGVQLPAGSLLTDLCPELAAAEILPVVQFTRAGAGTAEGVGAVHLEATQTHICDGSGSPTGQVIISLRDITEQAIQEGRLSFLATALDKAAGGITIIDPNLRIIYVNQAQAAMHQYRVDELVGKTIDIFCNPDEIRRLQETILSPGDVDDLWTGEAVNITKDGAAIPVLLSVSMIRGADGRVSAIVGVTKDIHTYKELERDMRSYNDHLASLVSARTRELEESRHELEMMFDAVSDFMFVVDRNLKVVRANRFSASFFHCRRRDLVGRKCYRVLAGSDRPCTGCPAARVFEAGDTAFATRTFRDERVHVWAYPIREDHADQGLIQSAPSQAFCYGKIMTKELATEERLQQAEKMASLGQLAAGVAHELRNPLGTILAAEYAIKSRVNSDDPEVHRALTTIESNVERATRIIANLLEFGRKGDWSMRPSSLPDIIRQVLSLADDLLKRRHIEVEIRLPPVPDVMGSPDGLRQVFLNIVHNAAQAMPNGGHLSVSVEKAPAQTVRVVVADTGSGIPQEYIPRVFDPFFTTKEPGQGTGLGLAICYREVERHRGFIRISSVLGEGTRVEVELPCIPAGSVR
ncbi:MAG: PAS domain S-box protein [Clostridia bacterium]|nr:PAS domain S-box protein [Clostridia bacterium]